MPNDTPNDIFISYSRRDLEFVTRLHQELSNRGLSAWFDKENISLADHWRTSIAEGIRDCKVFVLVLSPDSTASVNVRKEVDLAERHNKTIVPLMWRQTDIPVAMEYQLAGIQYIDLNETEAPEHFNQIANVLNRLLGGSSLQEATSDTAIAVESNIPAIKPEASETTTGQKTGRRRLGGLKKKPKVSPLAIGGLVISGVVTTFGLDVEDQDFVNEELKWLFSAAAHFQKIRRNEVNSRQPVPVPVPEGAEQSAGTSNILLNTVDDFTLQLWDGQVESQFKRINIHLRNLKILITQEAQLGAEGQRNVALQNQIKGERSNIVKVLQEMAQLMKQAYGVFVTSPDQLVELLELQSI